jgi:hypothetical protein
VSGRAYVSGFTAFCRELRRDDRQLGHLSPRERDFIADWLADRERRHGWPVRAGAFWDELESYLRGRNACPEALAAAESVWRRWARARRRARHPGQIELVSQ